MSEFKVYNTDEVAKILGVTRMTVTRYIKSGKLKCFKLGNRLVRITQEMLDEYIANNVRVHRLFQANLHIWPATGLLKI